MMQAIRNIIAAFHSDEEDDDYEESGRSPVNSRGGELRSVAVATFSEAAGGAGSDTTTTGSAESFWSESDSESESEETYKKSGVPVVLRGEYYARIGNDYWAKQSEMVMQVYRLFLEYSPLTCCVHTHAYTEVDLVGLEYLLSDVGRKQYPTLAFPTFVLNTNETAQVKPLHDGCVDTFIVSRTLDYVYGRLIELALMHTAHQRRLPPGLDGVRNAYWARRNTLFPLCRRPQCIATGEDNERLCHHQVVVYTRLDSDFYQRCERLRDRNGHVDYEKHSGTIVRQRLSYHLVNLLCGPFMAPHPVDPASGGSGTTALSQVEKYDKWIVVPIDYVDLWNATLRPELNTTLLPYSS